jgi:hypothetical protein
MSKKFDELIAETLVVERERRALSGDKPSLRCFIAECLKRAGEDYSAVEQIKERMTEPVFALKSGCSAFVRDLTRQIANGRFPAPPEAKRVGSLYFNQKDEAVMELGGEPKRLFSLWVIAAELAYQQTPGVFGNVEDLEKHKARLVELEARRAELYKSFPTTWKHDDLHIGRITSDGAALITFAKATGEVPVHPPASAAERLIDYLLGREEPRARDAA